MAIPSREGLVPSGLAGAAVLTSGVVGVAIAVDVPLGLGLLVAVWYGPLALYRPDLGVPLFVPLVFLEALPALNLAGKVAGLLIAVAWWGAAQGGGVDLRGLVQRHRRMLEALALLLLWLSLSTLWAEDAGRAGADLWHWWAVALLFVIVATTATSAGLVRLTVAAFIVGALLSVVIGFATGEVATGSALQSAADPDARLEGAVGDPNFLASGLVAALVLCGALLVAARGATTRWALLVAAGVLVSGLVASQSRGGIVAAAVMVLAAFVFFRRRRAYVALLLLVLVGVAAASLSASPEAWDRLTTLDNGGSGRTDLWTVSWRAFEDHPVAGVGLNNFEVVSGDYTRQPGTLRAVRKIAEQPNVVHNTYLQLLAENGLIGLPLFLGFVFACLRAAWLAGRRFEARGQADLEALARAVLVGAIGMLAASFFISAGVDKRLWILLALGPALLAVAEAERQR
ncbi:MAG: O-antigen ligase family protein [Thermoleophilaceae bacterium]